jgi:hypothetical protein
MDQRRLAVIFEDEAAETQDACPVVWAPGMSYLHPDFQIKGREQEEDEEKGSADGSNDRSAKALDSASGRVARLVCGLPKSLMTSESRNSSAGAVREGGSSCDNDDLEGDELMQSIDRDFQPVDFLKAKQQLFLELPSPARRKGSLEPLPFVSSLPSSPATSTCNSPAAARRVVSSSYFDVTLPNTDRSDEGGGGGGVGGGGETLFPFKKF